MNSDIISECTAKSLAGQITFPEVVAKLARAGVERYVVDLVGRQKYSYGTNGEYYAAPLLLPDMPVIPESFGAASVKSAIAEIQRQKIDYTAFLRQIMQAGCCHYEVYINGRQAVYFGRAGCQHVELFPDAK